jgi:hypothetical protein
VVSALRHEFRGQCHHKPGLTKGATRGLERDHAARALGQTEINDTEPARADVERVLRRDDAGRYVNIASTAPPLPVQCHGEPPRSDTWRHRWAPTLSARHARAHDLGQPRLASVGLVSTVFLVVIGVIIGALAGYFGGWIVLLSRTIEIFSAFRSLLILIVGLPQAEPGKHHDRAGRHALDRRRAPVRGEFPRPAGTSWWPASRWPRSTARSSARSCSAMGPVLVTATFSVATGILTESARPSSASAPPVPSWGGLRIESRSPEHW